MLPAPIGGGLGTLASDDSSRAGGLWLQRANSPPSSRAWRERPQLTAPPFDPAALNEVVALVADHAPGWAKTDAAARADLLSRVIADTLAAPGRLVG